MLKDIKGFEGLYKVNELGEVYTKYGSRKRTTRNARTGYHTVYLTKKDGSFRLYVHRIVAEAFIPNPEGKPQVNHKNGDKLDNRAENLEWCTQSENIRHAYQNGLHHGTSRRVQALSRNGEVHHTFESVKEAAFFCGCTSSNICCALRGKRPTACGYIWRYV